MEIVLTQDVVGLGDVGQKVIVKSGYARNFLLPQGMAVEIGSASARQAAHKMKQVEAKKKRFKVEAEKLVDKLKSTKVELELRVGKSGKVFGSLSTRDIATKLQEAGFDIDRRRVLLAEPIKKIGKQSVGVKLHPEVTTEIEIDVKAVKPTKEEESQEASEAKQKIETASEENDTAENDASSSEGATEDTANQEVEETQQADSDASEEAAE